MNSQKIIAINFVIMILVGSIITSIASGSVSWNNSEPIALIKYLPISMTIFNVIMYSLLKFKYQDKAKANIYMIFSIFWGIPGVFSVITLFS